MLSSLSHIHFFWWVCVCAAGLGCNFSKPFLFYETSSVFYLILRVLENSFQTVLGVCRRLSCWRPGDGIPDCGGFFSYITFFNQFTVSGMTTLMIGGAFGMSSFGTWGVGSQRSCGLWERWLYKSKGKLCGYFMLHPWKLVWNLFSLENNFKKNVLFHQVERKSRITFVNGIH